MSTKSDWKRMLRRMSRVESPRAERRTPTGVTAWHGEGASQKLEKIKNISSTGLYLLTGERWSQGELISLTLQGEGRPEDYAELQISVAARVVQLGADGIGLSFVLPAAMDAKLWAVLLRNALVLTETPQILLTFQTLRAMLFLCRLCPSGAEESILLLGGELDEFRTGNALKIAHSAEERLAAEPEADRMRAHPSMVANILRHGSWEGDDWARELWSGLLLSSCTTGIPDESSQPFVELLVRGTPTQAHILFSACAKATERMREAEATLLPQILCTPEEMIEISGLYDLTRIATDVSYLFHDELLSNNFDYTSYLPTESYDITPTRLGLELYERCKVLGGLHAGIGVTHDAENPDS